MTLGFTNLVRKIGLNSPPICLAVIGLLLVFIGAMLDNSSLIDISIIFTILGFGLSFFWKIVKHIMGDKEKS